MLGDGRALKKFLAICAAQGGFMEPPVAPLRHEIASATSGRVSAIDNRVLARIAKLAGAPSAKAAGIEMYVKVGEVVAKGQPLFSVHAEEPGELDYALAYVTANSGTIKVMAQ
jgi:thymidine phosphorylase